MKNIINSFSENDDYHNLVFCAIAWY